MKETKRKYTKRSPFWTARKKAKGKRNIKVKRPVKGCLEAYNRQMRNITPWSVIGQEALRLVRSVVERLEEHVK